MQNWIGDVDFAVSASRTATIQVPQHVLRAPGHVGGPTSTAATKCHASIAGTVDQDNLPRTRAVGDEVLRLAVVCSTQHAAL